MKPIAEVVTLTTVGDRVQREVLYTFSAWPMVALIFFLAVLALSQRAVMLRPAEPPCWEAIKLNVETSEVKEDDLYISSDVYQSGTATWHQLDDNQASGTATIMEFVRNGETVLSLDAPDDVLFLDENYKLP